MTSSDQIGKETARARRQPHVLGTPMDRHERAVEIREDGEACRPGQAPLDFVPGRKEIARPASNRARAWRACRHRS
jgi:hypothetical protein